MKIKPLLVCALLGALCSFARSETVIKILHIQTNPQIHGPTVGTYTGQVFNDSSAGLASGDTTPEKAAKAIEASWQRNKSQ